jgi:hypothetical protein
MEMMQCKGSVNEAQCGAATRATASCDQEVWVRERILTAIRMALAINAQLGVRADENISVSAIDGIANGAAVEIIRILNLEPEFTNLRRVGI